MKKAYYIKNTENVVLFDTLKKGNEQNDSICIL